MTEGQFSRFHGWKFWENFVFCDHNKPVKNKPLRFSTNCLVIQLSKLWFSWFKTVGKFCILWSQQNVEDERLKVSTNHLVKQMSELCEIGWSTFYLLIFNWVVDRRIQKKNFLFCLIYPGTKISITLTQ